MDAATKEIIKRCVLGTLASPKKNARKGAAQAVSAIAAIELPKHQWDDIIITLTLNAMGEGIEFKLASLDALGYICDELPEKVLTDSQVDTILSALIANIKPTIESNDVKNSALQALISCIKFCEKNFKVEAEKLILVQNIILSCVSPNSDIRLKAMQCLLEIVRCYYDYLGGRVLESIASATFNDIRVEDTEEVALISIEIWCSICDEEIDRLKHPVPAKPCREYIRAAYTGLMSLLLESLKKKSPNDESDWNIPVASACCLNLIAAIAKDNITDQVMPYVAENIGSADWKCKDAALLAFASILKGPAKGTMVSIVGQALPSLLELLKDPKTQIRETTAWTFVKIAQYTHEALQDPESLMHIMPALLLSLRDKPKISNQICFVLHNMAEVLVAQENCPSGPLSPYFKDTVRALWENAFREDGFSENVNLANNSFASLSNIIQFSADDTQPMFPEILGMLLTEFNNTLGKGFKFPTKTLEYQGYLCSAMQTVFIKIPGGIKVEMATPIVEAILNSFHHRQTVYDEGILALSGLSTAVGKEFTQYMEGLGPFVVFALKSQAETSLCRVAVGCVGDLARSLDQKISEYLGQFMPIMMDILRNADTDRSVKLVILSVISDIAISSGRFFIPYLPEVLEMLRSAAFLTLQPYNNVFLFLII